MVWKAISSVLFFLFVFALTGCGGGGSAIQPIQAGGRVSPSRINSGVRTSMTFELTNIQTIGFRLSFPFVIKAESAANPNEFANLISIWKKPHKMSINPQMVFTAVHETLHDSSFFYRQKDSLWTGDRWS